VNLVVAIIAKVAKLLTLSGSVSAFVIGFLTFRFTGIGGWILLMLFFITANILSKLSRSIAKNTVLSGIQKKGGTRDWAQVLANGGLAGVAALFYGLSGEILALVMFGSAIAASTADTWAGEAGILSKRPPVSMRTFQIVPKGMSGGVTWLGTLSSLVGSAMIAIAWYATFAHYGDHTWLFLASIVAISGAIGSLADSFLGATVQGHYYDPKRKQITEHEQRDGVKFELCRGVRWIDNDVVNFLSNAVAVLVASGFSLIIL
jgi:uncharacterized protein (TIGR00297 family)